MSKRPRIHNELVIEFIVRSPLLMSEISFGFALFVSPEINFGLKAEVHFNGLNEKKFYKKLWIEFQSILKFTSGNLA
ncbi:MAG: hypothetical protein SAK29_25305 [Scytonema sp. PMC 1069.18]|nr:hypothetical protein [Scytonema sp. PMC 1069.18]MEC4887139.1 hypothetical protein [Scytonema sp. PMC 1070.18]